ncbi:hypothetical protein Y1Q_0020905 [Alligator mississippiensis]|uniref:Uncharacterized protein n=1 Tax=Alligator mississippiensis TaxID=8496 RepID=A0A151NJB0_ALLMI|nr:hypothetical protein Y1Q_0020905 [Alligator mississippiensis]
MGMRYKWDQKEGWPDQAAGWLAPVTRKRGGWHLRAGQFLRQQVAEKEPCRRQRGPVFGVNPQVEQSQTCAPGCALPSPSRRLCKDLAHPGSLQAC